MIRRLLGLVQIALGLLDITITLWRMAAQPGRGLSATERARYREVAARMEGRNP